MTLKQRIIPEGMRPKPTEQSATTAEEKKEVVAVTARVENIAEGMCPICLSSGNRQEAEMQRSTANGIEVHWCADHSLVMPVRDTQ